MEPARPRAGLSLSLRREGAPAPSSSSRAIFCGSCAGIFPAFSTRMNNAGAESAASPAEAAPDIIFSCEHCSSPLVVDGAAAGHTLDCQQCAKPITVPAAQPSSDERAVNPAVADIHRRLKENASQRTEITSYINQHSIQLSRWQLRLQTLHQRQKELHDELVALQTAGQ